MAETKKTDKPAETPKLAPAGASGNAEVQNLLAQRSIHTSNGDDAKVAEVDRALADLGYAV